MKKDRFSYSSYLCVVRVPTPSSDVAEPKPLLKRHNSTPPAITAKEFFSSIAAVMHLKKAVAC